jgi:hypothetical protein
MRVLRVFAIGFVSAAISLGLLFLVYPWSTYYNNFTYGAGITVASYLLLAFLVGLVGAVVVGVMSYTSLSIPGQSALTGVLSFAILFAGSLTLGPGGVDLFNTRVEGIFFSEWKFVIFIGTVALPISILDAILIWWTARWESVTGGPGPSQLGTGVDVR